MTSTQSTTHWYNKTWLVVILCIFFFPIGLYALWKSSVISKGWKIGGTILVGLLVIAAINDKDGKTKTSKSTSVQKETPIETKEIETTPKKLTEEEYLNSYSTQLSSIKLEKMFGIAPLYGTYADALNNVLLDMESKDSLFHIFNNKNIKSLHDKNRKIQEQALSNYIKYGNPDDEDHFFIFAQSSCETALEQVLNDPDYEIVKERYYLKQTAKGYDYKLLIRGKNAFGAKILKEMTFALQYNPMTREYIVTSVR